MYQNLMNRERLVEKFTEIVRIDSPTGKEGAMAGWLLNHFEKRGITAERDRVGNVFARIPGAGEPIFLAAHMDTVQPGEKIEPVIDDDGDTIRSSGETILGADNKSTIAVFLEVIESLKENKIPHHPVEFLFTVDEEAASIGATEFDYRKLRARSGLIADIALPVGTVIIATPWYGTFDIELKGLAAHASRPKDARSVLPALQDLQTQIPVGEVDEQTIVNLGIGSFGTARNTVPGNLTLQGELRSFDETLFRERLDAIISATSQIQDAHQLSGGIAKQRIGAPGYIQEEDHPLIARASDIFVREGIPPRFVRTWSRSDGNYFNEKGLYVVNVGDGTRDTHTTSESIPISEMERLTRFFIGILTV